MTDEEMANVIIKRLYEWNEEALINAAKEDDYAWKKFWFGKAVAFGEAIEDIKCVIQFKDFNWFKEKYLD